MRVCHALSVCDCFYCHQWELCDIISPRPQQNTGKHHDHRAQFLKKRWSEKAQTQIGCNSNQIRRSIAITSSIIRYLWIIIDVLHTLCLNSLMTVNIQTMIMIFICIIALFHCSYRLFHSMFTQQASPNYRPELAVVQQEPKHTSIQLQVL